MLDLRFKIFSILLFNFNNCKANKITSPRLSYFTLSISKLTLRALEDWRVGIYLTNIFITFYRVEVAAAEEWITATLAPTVTALALQTVEAFYHPEVQAQVDVWQVAVLSTSEQIDLTNSNNSSNNNSQTHSDALTACPDLSAHSLQPVLPATGLSPGQTGSILDLTGSGQTGRQWARSSGPSAETCLMEVRVPRAMGSLVRCRCRATCAIRVECRTDSATAARSTPAETITGALIEAWLFTIWCS